MVKKKFLKFKNNFTSSRSECDMKVSSSGIFNCWFELYVFQGLDSIFLVFTSSCWNFNDNFLICFQGSKYIKESSINKMYLFFLAVYANMYISVLTRYTTKLLCLPIMSRIQFRIS